MLESLLAFAVVLLLCFAGLPLSFVTLAVGIAGLALLRGIEPALSMAGQQTLDIVTNAGLSVIPIFILMGNFIYRANISQELYDAGYATLGRFRGGLAMSTVLACAGFAAVCGSSLASAATMAKVAVPSMRRYRYADSLSTGSVAAGGTLGIMIPPSVPMIIYGVVAEQDIAALFIAGVLPGALLVAIYLATTAAWTSFRREHGPAAEALPWSEAARAISKVWPVGLLFVAVLGGIYLGVFTPTEAAAVGAGGAFAFAFARGRLRRPREIAECCIDAVKTSALIFSVAIGALVFANYLNLIGAPYELVAAVDSLNLGPAGVVAVIAAICIALGTVFESIGILLLVIPVFLPTLIAAGVDLIWFGIIAIIVIEMGLITPPIGMNVFTVKAALPEVPLKAIFQGVGPFIVADVAALAVVFSFPAIALWLPSFM